ncbi:MAG TPA: protein kinase [Kofleriaceae bacterium]|nr:protein kinase [Kofleriaceae bacterium]
MTTTGKPRPPVVPTGQPAARGAKPLDRTIIDTDKPNHGFDEEPKTSIDQVKVTPGLRIEQYELIRELGRGGMGQVFLARDNRLGRRVAIKFLSSGSKRHTERFLVEARATARCNHENIVAIYDVDEYLGLPYMVLEYVEGATLAKLMENRRMAVGRSVELILPVLRALARAHEMNIIHRDLKPENIVVTGGGAVKVLDFGVAKLFQSTDATPRPSRQRPPTPGGPLYETQASGGAFAGTLPYMSPEQLGVDDVDHRSDLWAIGIILYEMLAAKHPLEPVTQGRLFGAAAAVDEPMPSIGNDMPGLPDRLVAIVDKCLAKKKLERYATAEALIADLEPLLPGRSGRSLSGDESPYPGLTAFQEADANRFFGRSQDIAGMIARLRDQPLVAVVGPSGVGKSSFVRAGVVPALKSSGEAWDVMIVRPGRYPLSALASTLESLRDSRDSDPFVEGEDLTFKLRSEPGLFGAKLRARAKKKRSSILLFVDQHEELYTLVPDAKERAAFTACLAGAGDDPSGPIRVVVSMRSDFLDRAAEDRRFVEELTRGLVFLQPPSRTGLEEALTQPLEMVGYSFESGVVHAMLEALEATSGSLPLLQFTAAKLWETRDRQRRVLTRDAYLAMGGVAGALATHADEVLAGLSAPDQKLARAVFQRLVTPERTRAIVDTAELRDISHDIDRIVTHLVSARLLVVQSRGDGAGAVELVHESLIKSWPTLQRWLDENQEDAAYLGQIRAASKQWDSKGRPEGLLWRAEAMEELRLWYARYTGELPDRERAYVDAVIELGTRAARRRRNLVVSAFVVLLALVGAAGVAVVLVLQAEQRAIAEKAKTEEQRRNAEEQRKQAEQAKQIAEDEKRKAVEEQHKAEEALAAKDEALHAKDIAQQQTKQEMLAKAKALDDAAREAALKAKAQQVAAAKQREAEKAALAAKKADAKATEASKPADERRKKITTTLPR